MVAGIGCVVASAAEPGNAGLIQNIVQTSHPGEIDRYRVEHLLAARNRAACRDLRAIAGEIGPGVKCPENCRVKSSAGRIEAERVVDADEKILKLLRQNPRTALSAVAIQIAGLDIEQLSGEYSRASRYVGARTRIV